MNIDLADVTLHVDETLDREGLTQLEDAFRARDGVVSVHIDSKRPHLFLIEYNPERINSQDLLAITHFQGLHAQTDRPLTGPIEFSTGYFPGPGYTPHRKQAYIGPAACRLRLSNTPEE